MEHPPLGYWTEFWYNHLNKDRKNSWETQWKWLESWGRFLSRREEKSWGHWEPNPTHFTYMTELSVWIRWSESGSLFGKAKGQNTEGLKEGYKVIEKANWVLLLTLFRWVLLYSQLVWIDRAGFGPKCFKGTWNFAASDPNSLFDVHT